MNFRFVSEKLSYHEIKNKKCRQFLVLSFNLDWISKAKVDPHDSEWSWVHVPTFGTFTPRITINIESRVRLGRTTFAAHRYKPVGYEEPWEKRFPRGRETGGHRHRSRYHDWDSWLNERGRGREKGRERKKKKKETRIRKILQYIRDFRPNIKNFFL